MNRKNPFNKFIKGETALHIAVCEYIAYQHPDLLFHHSPNEGKRSPFERYLIKRMNVSSGFPDLMIVDSKENKTLFLELKYGNNIPTESQIKWLVHLSKLDNVYVRVAWTFQSAINIIKEVFDNDYFYNGLQKNNKGVVYDKYDEVPIKFF